MSNPMFENPKIALGFAGVVVAVALVASVAFKEFSPSDEGSGEALSEQQALAAPAVSQQSQAGFASGPATGWANDADATDDVDGEGSGLTYALLDSPDGDLFRIDPLTGVVSTKADTGIEQNADQNGDGVYQLAVQVSDQGGLSDIFRLTVSRFIGVAIYVKIIMKIDEKF